MNFMQKNLKTTEASKKWAISSWKQLMASWGPHPKDHIQHPPVLNLYLLVASYLSPTSLWFSPVWPTNHSHANKVTGLLRETPELTASRRALHQALSSVILLWPEHHLLMPDLCNHFLTGLTLFTLVLPSPSSNLQPKWASTAVKWSSHCVILVFHHF